MKGPVRASASKEAVGSSPCGRLREAGAAAGSCLTDRTTHSYSDELKWQTWALFFWAQESALSCHVPGRVSALKEMAKMSTSKGKKDCLGPGSLRVE